VSGSLATSPAKEWIVRNVPEGRLIYRSDTAYMHISVNPFTGGMAVTSPDIRQYVRCVTDVETYPIPRSTALLMDGRILCVAEQELPN
jgi:hypothetical protein